MGSIPDANEFANMRCASACPKSAAFSRWYNPSRASSSSLDRKKVEIVVSLPLPSLEVDNVGLEDGDDIDDDIADADSRAHKLPTNLEYIQTNCLPTLVSRHEYTSSSFFFLLDDIIVLIALP
mmetsp:Transcript_27034/g.54019  ORF Transcript_27034/g.54019 Transcript_27034/m.54019 type:complete len:123 (-) Transcript_27034:243-611(-)